MVYSQNYYKSSLHSIIVYEDILCKESHRENPWQGQEIALINLILINNIFVKYSD